ncbi:hypothetical protein BJ742DRAFT_834786 [Cladochytrium replicatum]|nr:hypothetical protein BJ742DRAFT_834786 [Cladochytrium replicatum]
MGAAVLCGDTEPTLISEPAVALVTIAIFFPDIFLIANVWSFGSWTLCQDKGRWKALSLSTTNQTFTSHCCSCPTEVNSARHSRRIFLHPRWNRARLARRLGIRRPRSRNPFCSLPLLQTVQYPVCTRASCESAIPVSRSWSSTRLLRGDIVG